MEKTENYDVVIIGAGVIGGAAARELSKYNLNILALEKEVDVCCGVSKANTGIIHSPALVPAGSLKARMAVRGAAVFDKLSGELGFRYQKCGALIAGFSDDAADELGKYIETGIRNYSRAGREPAAYRLLEAEELRETEPALSQDVRWALHAPDCGRIIPYEYGIALWENAVANGVRLELDTRVERLKAASDGRWTLSTCRGEYSADFVINAAGHGSNELGMQAGFHDSRISPVKGQYLILDREGGPGINHVLFQVPRPEDKKKGKGILVTRTIYGNIMIGPDARPQDGREDTATDLPALDQVAAGALRLVPGLRIADCIKTFAGIRPKPSGGDFIIESGRGIIHLCGIESPGLTASPAIAEDILFRLKEQGLRLEAREDFNPLRKPIVDEVLRLPPEELNRRIALEPGEPGRIICRCEQVPEARIVDAISRGLPVTTIDGVKRRCRAGQGRCQGGFCGPRVRRLLAGRLGIAEDRITVRGNEPEIDRITAREIRRIYG